MTSVCINSCSLLFEAVFYLATLNNGLLLSWCSAVVCDWVFQLASEQQRRRNSSVAETPECVQTSGTPSSGNSSVQEEYPDVLSEVNRVNSQDDNGCIFSAQSQVCKENNKEEWRGELEDW